MRKLLVCQHVPFEILGTLNPLLKESGFRMRYVNFGRHPDAKPSLEGYQGLIILGGPMNAEEFDKYGHLATEIRLIRKAIRLGLPVLGICLGAQLIAKALGARVERSRVEEIGWYSVSTTKEGSRDPLFSHFGRSEKIFQWHSDTFDIPRGALRLAASSTCNNQAFRWGNNVYGFQFHLEVDEPLIERWLTVPTHRRQIESLQGRVDPEKIRKETPVHMKKLEPLSERTFREFIGLFPHERTRRIVLPSR